MCKKWIVSFLASATLIILSSTIFASSSFKISINGESVKLPNQAKVEDDQLLVPIRWITEKLGATLGWNEAESSINIKTANQIQIDRFMDVKRDTTAKKLVELWLQGLRTRSGSLQYATLSPKLQQSTYKTFENQYWGTGGSSPWMENVVISPEEHVQDNLVRFVVDYDLASSNWHWSGGRKEITVERILSSPYEAWEITSIHTKFNEYEIFTPSETVNDTNTKASGSVHLTDNEVKDILEELIPKATTIYGMFNGSGWFTCDGNKTIPGAENYCLATGDTWKMLIDTSNVKSIAELKEVVENVFTKDIAQKLFYSGYLESEDSTSLPLYKDYEGRLYANTHNGGHGWAREFLIDTAKMKSQKDNVVDITLDATSYDDPEGTLIITIEYVNGKWLMASGLHDYETRITGAATGYVTKIENQRALIVSPISRVMNETVKEHYEAYWISSIPSNIEVGQYVHIWFEDDKAADQAIYAGRGKAVETTISETQKPQKAKLSQDEVIRKALMNKDIANINILVIKEVTYDEKASIWTIRFKSASITDSPIEEQTIQIPDK